jgi:biotin carboxyl carrier protein
MTTRLLSPVTGVVWKLSAQPGTTLMTDDEVLVLESMKMEIPVTAPHAGRLARLHVAEGEAVNEGQLLAEIVPENG